MDKDVRGIERGKCACGECEDFMRSDGATCGYCGCLPTRHSKKDSRYSSDSVGGTSVAGTSEIVGSSPSSLSQESSPETDFTPEPRAENQNTGESDTGRERQLFHFFLLGGNSIASKSP
ncbi:unnamed protein product [Porites evermanni]|uniref:Uncharacterized protein n=1 Tax=Porites evermanni TaxID=104178 RepID=A0ABN8Q3Z0_9CNID|nr:unnamed protein product [Porites evermanni]